MLSPILAELINHIIALEQENARLRQQLAEAESQRQHSNGEVNAPAESVAETP